MNMRGRGGMNQGGMMGNYMGGMNMGGMPNMGMGMPQMNGGMGMQGRSELRVWSLDWAFVANAILNFQASRTQASSRSKEVWMRIGTHMVQSEQGRSSISAPRHP